MSKNKFVLGMLFAFVLLVRSEVGFSKDLTVDGKLSLAVIQAVAASDQNDLTQSKKLLADALEAIHEVPKFLMEFGDIWAKTNQEKKLIGEIVKNFLNDKEPPGGGAPEKLTQITVSEKKNG